FHGCIRNLYINDQLQDLTHPASGVYALMGNAMLLDNPPSAVSVRRDGPARFVTSRSTTH
ncbi:hypothetical protein M9458_001824, partial [Cirrhinus mrigala]